MKAMSIQENQNDTIIEPESEVKIETELQADDWLCISCSKKITNEKERFFYEGQTEFEFTNPEGYLFHIITFRTAEGCREEGKPTQQFTWFKNYSWSFALCSRCGLHLGWKYRNKTDSFYGLIKSRLVKGLALFN